MSKVAPAAVVFCCSVCVCVFLKWYVLLLPGVLIYVSTRCFPLPKWCSSLLQVGRLHVFGFAMRSLLRSSPLSGSPSWCPFVQWVSGIAPGALTPCCSRDLQLHHNSKRRCLCHVQKAQCWPFGDQDEEFGAPLGPATEKSGTPMKST